MSSNTSDDVRNLNDNRARALDTVLGRLGDILGEDIPEDTTRRNKNGELVDEEGLPIVDINEPIDDLDTPSLSAATEEDGVIEDNYPEPTSKLSPEALAIGRKHRDKILDLLEEEEAHERERTWREQREELARKREAARSEMQRRMATQGAELEKRRKMKELEKKMAKALVSSSDPEPHSASKVDPKPMINKGKKSVTFASVANDPTPPHDVEHVPTSVWGDVVPGRLPDTCKTSRPQPMKMEVVERSLPSKSVHPEPIPSSREPHAPEDAVGDSDDESEENTNSDSTIAFDSGDEDVLVSAQYHRELALEYHGRREALASTGAIQLQNIGSYGALIDSTSNNWDKEDVPLEATLARPLPMPKSSKFKTELVNAHFESSSVSHGLPSQTSPQNSAPSLGTSVIPPGALSKEIKMGKLVDGKLVADHQTEEEQEAREEEEIRKLLINSMETYSGIAAQVMGSTGSHYLGVKAQDPTTSSATQPPSKPENKRKMSRFKVNRTHS